MTKQTTDGEQPRPVKSIVATESDLLERDFAGLSTPVVAVNLAFKVSGQILRVPIAKGELVAVGDILCRLDPRDIELQLISDKSTFEQSKSSYERAERLLSHEAISIQEVERAESNYLTSKSIYENTLEILDQTTLRSPFSAVVERVYVDEYQRVQAGETVVRIVSPTTSRVEFTLPESSLAAIKDSLTRFKVRFDNIRDVSFDARVIEYARTSSDASGFPVTLEFKNPDPQRYSISSGMSCMITMLTPQPDKGAVVLPLSAIYSPTSGGTYVWIIDSQNRVDLRRVEMEEPTGQSSVVIDSGVKSGERVVTAGVYQLRSGEVVKSISK